MTDVVAQVKRVSELIAEITAAAGEQRQGIEQVGGAVSLLDQTTQQNAALVEQSAAAAESLKQQARKLAEVVSAFKTEA
jgi:methyl-accepting chemotaxis protein